MASEQRATMGKVSRLSTQRRERRTVRLRRAASCAESSPRRRFWTACRRRAPCPFRTAASRPAFCEAHSALVRSPGRRVPRRSRSPAAPSWSGTLPGHRGHKRIEERWNNMLSRSSQGAMSSQSEKGKSNMVVAVFLYQDLLNRPSQLPTSACLRKSVKSSKFS